jgi:biopolymer transport protein ExbB
MKCRLLTAALALMPSLSAFAQQTATAAAQPKQLDLLELVAGGGKVMYVLFVISIIMVAVAFILFITLRSGAVVTDKFMSDSEAMVRAGDLKGLSSYCRRQSQRMATIVQHTVDFILQNPAAGIEEIREIAQAEGSRQASQLTARVTYMADIGAIAPLVGLLGTVIGMTKSFFDLSAGKEGVQQLELTSGISMALVTTGAGLTVAVPALMLYAFFRGKSQRLVSELEGAATHFVVSLQMLAAQSRAGVPRPPQRTATDANPMPPLAMNQRDLHGI